MTTIKHSRRKMSTHWHTEKVSSSSPLQKQVGKTKPNVRNSYERNRRWHRNWGHYNSSVTLHIHHKLQLLFLNIKTRRIRGMVKKYIFHSVIKIIQGLNLVGLQEGNWGSQENSCWFSSRYQIKLAEHRLKPKRDGWNFSIRIKTYIVV